MNEQIVSQSGATTSDSAKADEAPVRRKRRRWHRWLGAVLLLLIILVWSVPYLLATGVGTRLIVEIANGSLPGELSIQDLSLTWLGPCTIRGAGLKDLQGKEVVRIDEIACATGVWHALASTKRFGELRIESPQVSVYVDQAGRISLVDALVRPDAPPAPKGKATPLPAVNGRILLQNGSIRIVRSDGRQLDVSPIKINCNLDTLDNIQGTMSLQVPKSGTLTGEMKLRNLAPGGQFKPFGATGTVRLSTPDDVALAELAAFAMGQAHTGGTANLKLDGLLDNGAVKVDLNAGVTGLQMPHAEGVRGEPIDARLSADIRATQESLTARASAEGQAGTGQIDVSYPLNDPSRRLSLNEVLSAVLSGKTDSLPQATVDGHCRVDLVKLTQAVPALLSVRPDVAVTSGTLDIERLAIRGGNKPSMAGTLALKNLVTRSGGKDIQWEPVSVGLDTVVEPDRGLKVQQAEFNSGFGRLVATGNASSLHAEMQANLAEVHRQLTQVFSVGPMELAGKIAGSLDLKRASDTRIDLATALTVDGLRYQSGKRQVQFDKAVLKHTGYLGLAGSSLNEVVVSAAEADVDGKIIASATGRATMASKAYQASLDVKRVDLAYVSERIKTVGGATDTVKYAGNAVMQAKIQKSAPDAPILSDGALTIRGASIGGAPVSTEDITCRWSEASLSPDAAHFQLKMAQLSSSVARVSATAVDCRLGKQPTASGSFEGNADLAPLLSTISRAFGRDKPPAIAGRLTSKGSCDSTAERVRLASTWNIDALEIGAGDRAVREKQVRLAIDSTLNRKDDTLDIAQIQLDSQLLALKLGGKISEFTGAQRLALNGEYKGSWDSITALIHELAPSTADALVISGSTGSRFEVTGNAYQPTVRPVFQDVTSGLDLTWASVRAYGLDLGKGTLSPSLKQGQLQVPLAVIPASGGGQVRLGGVVDFRAEQPTLYLRDKAQLMENIPITPALGKYLLSRVNPLFGNLTRAEGSASLVVQGVELPLSDEIKRRGAGQGRLDLRNLKITPGDLMAEAIALGGQGKQDAYTVKVDGLDFVLKNGRLMYDNFVLTFPNDFDLRFRGSVGFDDTIDLIMSVPVRPALLERLGVRGPVDEYARLLADARVEIPVVGTRSNPSMDLTRVDAKPLVARAMRGAAAGKTGDLLKSLEGSKPPAKAEPGKAPSGPDNAGKRSPAPTRQKKPADLLRRLESVTSKPAGTDTRKRP